LVKSGELIISLNRGFVEPAETPEKSPLVTSLQKTAGDVLGNKVRVENCINSGCDMRLRRLYDKDCQCVWYGPGGNRCHQSGESVSFEELGKITRVLAEWIIRECGA
jgi:acetylornithine deacetylase/succinyl-diaminopimelate desuccinylase-like protein